MQDQERGPKAAQKFYEILLKRENILEVLLCALRETNQTGAYSILVDVPVQNGKLLQEGRLGK